jgi:aminoglycoside phosphotransferase (APT) family kinase protein
MGINSDSLSDWLDRNIDFLERPFVFELINGGRSNLSYLITDSKLNRVVLRRPPVSHVLSSAHDMHREFKMISSLKSTEVEVPTPYCYVEDTDITGAPFYVMSFENGLILRSVSDVEQHFSKPERRRVLSENLIASLVKLHGVDYQKAGLKQFLRNENYVDRLLERWITQFDKTKGDDLQVNETVSAVYYELKENNPNNPENTVIHGDYRLDNVVVTSEGEVQAILDWELSTIGDPLSDLGLTLVYWGSSDMDSPLNLPSPTTLEGFMKPADLLKFYERASGRSTDNINYYMALGYWKLACILQGVYKRYSSGARAGDSSGVEGFGGLILTLTQSAGKMLHR